MKIYRDVMILFCALFLFSSSLFAQDAFLETSASWFSYQPYSSLGSAITADLDRDGYLDLIVQNTGGVYVHYSDNGVLDSVPVQQFSTGSMSYNRGNGLAAIDYDNDGMVEVAMFDSRGRAVIAENNGGELTVLGSWTNLSHGSNTTVLWADVTGNEYMDLIVGGGSYSHKRATRVYTNKSGTMSTIASWTSAPGNTTSMAAGKIGTGDYYVDLVLGDYNNFIRVYSTSGTKALQTSVSWSNYLGSHVYDVALGDWDNDNRLDLAVAAQNGVYVFTNAGTTLGTFGSTHAWYYSSTSVCYSVAWGDVDRDGYLDLSVGKSGNSPLVFINQKGSLPATPSWEGNEEATTYDILFSDLDNDMGLELITGANNGGTSKVYKNISRLYPRAYNWRSADTAYPDANGIDFADINKDGKADLVVASRSTYPSRLYLSTATNLSTNTSWTPSSHDFRFAALGDMDNDGDVDAALGITTGYLYLYKNTGTALSTTASWTNEVSAQYSDGAFVDVDGDGDLDLIVSDSLSTTRVFRNNSGVLEKTNIWGPTSTPAYDFEFGDVDNDGDSDLVYIRTSIAKLFLNENGMFKTSSSWNNAETDGSTPGAITLADVDQDGYIDLIRAASGGAVRLYRNRNGIFEYSSSWSSAFAEGTSSVKAVDINNDSYPDLVVANSSSPGQGYRVYLNKKGTFSSFPDFSTITNYGWGGLRSIAVNDVDQDGDMDLFFGSASYCKVIGIKNNYAVKVKNLPNNPPYISRVSNVKQANGNIGFIIYLYDQEYDFCDVKAQYSLSGQGQWKDCTGGVIVNARASGSGIGNRYTMTWQAASADKVTAPFVYVRFILSSRNTYGYLYTDSAGPIMYASSIYQRQVTISTDAAPYGQIVSPFSGQIIRKGSTNQIEGSAYDFNFKNYIVEIKTNSTAGGWTTITNSTVSVPPVGVLGKLKATQNPGFYKLRLRVYDLKNKVVYSSNIIRIIDVPEGTPTVVKTYPPINGSSVALNTVILAKFSSDMNESSLRSDTLTVSAGGVSVPGSLDYNYYTKTLVFEPAESLLPNTYYVVSISSNFQTYAGVPLKVNFNWGFQTDTELSTIITQVSPARGRNDVPTTTSSFSLKYNKKISSFYASYIYLIDFETGLKPSVTCTWRTNWIDGTINTTLKSNRIYIIRATNYSSVNYGTGVPACWESYFITSDTLQPRIVSNWPSKNQQISLNGDVRVKFNKLMNDASFKTNTFYITCSNNGKKLSGTREYNVAQDVVTFTPVAGSFTQGRTYIASLTPDVRDMGGIGLPAQSNWSFKTASPLPNPILINPVHNSTNSVLSGLTVYATFANDIDGATLTSSSFKVVDNKSKPVSGTLSLSNFRKIKFEPDGFISQNTYFTCIISKALKATNGTTLTNVFRWRFRTLPAIQSNQLVFSPPPSSTNVPLDTLVNITYTSTLDSSTVNAVNCALYYVQSGTSNFLPIDAYVTGGNILTISPKVNLPQNRLIRVRITTNIRVTTGVKLPRNIRYDFQTFKALASPTNLSPANGSTTAPLVASLIRAGFKTNMDASSLNASTFYVKSSSGTVIPGTLSVDGNAVQFVPDSEQMIQNTWYTCVVSKNLKSMALTTMSNDFKWSFRTVSPLVTPTNLSPAHLNTNVALSSVLIRAGFPVDIDSSSLNASTFFVVSAGGGHVSGALSVLSNAVQFSPESGQMSQNTWYTGVITHNLRSVDGTSMLSDYKWRFRTVSPLQNPTNISPLSGNTNVSLIGSVISAIFRTNLDAGTLNSSTFKVMYAGNPLPGTYSVNGKKVTFIPSEQLSHNTWYTSIITTSLKTYELTGLASDYSWIFRTYRAVSTGQIVLSPASGATNISLLPSVTVTFPTNLATGTLNAASFYAYYVQGSVTNTVPADVYISGLKTAQLQPSIMLPQNTDIFVRLTTDVQTVLGTSLTNDLSWSFKTLKPMAGTASEYPLNTSTNVSISTIIEATFATNLNPATINDQSFFVKSGTNLITGSRTYDNALRKITFTPADFLPANSMYTAFCTTNVRTVAGTSLVADKKWWFKTMPPLAPATNLSPLTLSSNIPLKNVIVKAVFRTNIDAGTLNSSTFYVHSQTGEEILGSYSVSGKAVTFNISSPLSHNTWYTNVLTTGLRTYERTGLTNDQRWRFKTLPRVNNSSIVEASPGSGVSNISTLISPVVRITNSQVLDGTTVNALNVWLIDVASGSNIVSSILFDAGLNRITVDPASELDLGKWYKVTVSTNVKTVNGTTFTSNLTWDFKTMAPYAVDVISSTPSSNQSSVILNSPISVIFATNVDAATVTPSSFYLIDQAGNGVGGNRSVTGKEISFSPSGGYLSQNTWYTLVIPSGEIRYTTGIKALQGKKIPFQTLSPLSGPTNLTPVATASNVPLKGIQVRAIFRTNIDAGSLNSSTFFIKSESGSVVPGEYSASGKMISFSPAGLLAMNTVYTACISSGLKTVERTSMVSDFKWSFQTMPDMTPAVAVLSNFPVANSSNAGVGVDPCIYISGSMPLDASTVNAINVYMENASNHNPIYGTVTFDGGQNKVTFQPSGNLEQGKRYRVTMTTNVRSIFGTKLTTNFSWTFRTTAPFAVDIKGTSPTNTYTNVSLNSSISVQFVTNIKSSSVTPSSFYVIDEDGNYLGGTRSVSGNVISFIPSGGLLQQNTSYTIVIPDNQLEYDVIGIFVVNGGKFWFKTASALQSPLSVFPGVGDTNCALTNKISATFSTNIISPISPSSFYVKDENGYTVSGSFSYPDSKTVKFAPLVPLQQNTVYTAVITSGLKSTLQTSLTNDFKWWFKTAPPKSQPTEFFPHDGQNNLDINIEIYASFGEALQSDTCNKDNFRVYQNDLPLPGSVSYDAALKRITFRPNVPLSPSNTFKVLLSKDVRTLSELSMTNDFEWSFSTGRSIGRGGGTIQSSDNRLKIQIPVNAIPEERVVTLTALDPTNMNTSPAGTVSIDIGYLLGPSGLVLKKPITLILDYSTGNLAGVDQKKLALFQKVNGQWVRVGGTINEQSKSLTVTTTSVGEFAVFEDSNVISGELSVSDIELQPRVFAPSRFDNLSISFKLGKTSKVRVRIFSVNGRPIANLPIFEASPGINAVLWDGRSIDGDVLPDGLYIISIDAEADGKHATSVKPFTLMDK